MGRQLTLLSDAEWARIEPLLPRGRTEHQVDDRRVMSGFIHILRSGAGEIVLRTTGPTTVYNRFNRWIWQGIWLGLFEALTGHSGVWGTWPSMQRTSRRTARRPAQKGGGGFAQAVGLSRGGRTFKLHGLTDDRGRPRVLLISAGSIKRHEDGRHPDQGCSRPLRSADCTQATIPTPFALPSPRLAPRW